MEQCESAAALLESVREQEVQFEQLTRALEEERRRVGLPATSPSGLGRPLPHTQVTLPDKSPDARRDARIHRIYTTVFRLASNISSISSSFSTPNIRPSSHHFMPPPPLLHQGSADFCL